jgi:hypothetical protein
LIHRYANLIVTKCILYISKLHIIPDKYVQLLENLFLKSKEILRNLCLMLCVLLGKTFSLRRWSSEIRNTLGVSGSHL